MPTFNYGRWAVLETLRANRRQLQRLLVAEGINERGTVSDILALAEQHGIEISRVPRRVLDDVAQHGNHQGVALRVGEYPYVEVEDLLQIAAERDEKPFFLALDLLQDPQNVGVLLRVADAVGVHGVILQARRGVEVTSAVVNASSGAVEHLAVAQVTNLVNALKLLKEHGVWLVGLDMGQDVPPIDQVDLNRSLTLVLGSEGEGMRRLVREVCDILVQLPMRGAVASLNVATVGAHVLYAAWQARGWEGWQPDESPGQT
ncbi:MAG: 23S rRNA (guanosine(2251)-2'-O)-methyltransferase RlmB [Anaerolineae bacterium]|nr:23S rRNA (guanosine(2251)-2'-O)-methyltransferase RlmB [Anaerolineae bacterium]